MKQSKKWTYVITVVFMSACVSLLRGCGKEEDVYSGNAVYYEH